MAAYTEFAEERGLDFLLKIARSYLERLAELCQTLRTKSIHLYPSLEKRGVFEPTCFELSSVKLKSGKQYSILLILPDFPW